MTTRARTLIVTVALGAALAVGGAACGTSLAPDPGLEGLALTRVAPDAIIPGTTLVLQGASFVDEQWGDATLRLTGTAGGRSVDVRWPAAFVDFGTMTVSVDRDRIAQLGVNVDFFGDARVEIVASSDGNTYASAPEPVTLTFREVLAPAVTSVESGGVIFVNDQLLVEGSNFLLGGDEGTTTARVTGCFTADSGGGCQPVTAQDLPLIPVDPLLRTGGRFAFSPTVAGIRPGSFTGEVEIINAQPSQAPSSDSPRGVTYDLVSAQVFSLCTGEPCQPSAGASLGQYVFVQGGGFVGGEAGATTELELTGQFTPTGGTAGASTSLTLIPEFVEGRLVRYVLNEDDELGQRIDLRAVTGQFSGSIRPVVTYGGDTVPGASTPVSFGITSVKQVVFLDFRPSYVEGLRDFGLRAVDSRLRSRIIELCNQAYAGVNMSFRTAPPTDFALYMHVELTGVDPNNMGLFGYDNTPGKDNGNVRLYDRLGGVNAATQQDGYPGYGGVFLRSLMGFSKHPGDFTRSVPGADPVFDKIFDPFRADLDKEPITSADLAASIPALTSGAGCPAKDRPTQVACAVYVLGNLIGGTLSHEIGHSLGLANPFAEGFHNAGDSPNRLMDSGGDRPFLERAILEGQGPGVFCDDEYTYLRMILPSASPAPSISRPGCF